MSLKLHCLNVRGLRDLNKSAHLLGKLSNLRMDVTMLQENLCRGLSGTGERLCGSFSI